MNRVGDKGEGESVWLAWFLCAVIDAFAPLVRGAILSAPRVGGHIVLRLRARSTTPAGMGPGIAEAFTTTARRSGPQQVTNAA